MKNNAEPVLQMIPRTDGIRLAARHRAGAGPTLIFLPGYASDMTGDKATQLDRWAALTGRAMLRFDYAGCGESEGRFGDGTLESWRDDALCVIDALAPGPLILIGSSMGGWIAMMLAEALGNRVKALVGIAAAPDFTEWGFTKETHRALESYRTPDTPDPSSFTRAFWESGQRCLMLEHGIAYTGPVRLLQGQQDDVVPFGVALQAAEALHSADVQVVLVKDGDHRLSRPQDIALLIATIAALGERD